MTPGSVRLAASATAWHWVFDQEEGLRRLARYISRGGWCALWWTLYHDPARPDDLYRAIEPIMSPIPHVLAPTRPGRTQYFALDRDERMKDIHQTGAFEDVRVDEFHWEMSLDPERARSLFGTFSPILALSPAEREDVLSRIEDVIRTRFGGAAQRSCVSVLYTARRT